MAIETLTRANGKDKSYRVYVWTNKGKRITKTFRSATEARAWQAMMTHDREKADGFANEHARKKTFADLIDKYILDPAIVEGKDAPTLNRLAWWRLNHGHIKLISLTEAVIDDALCELASGNAENYKGEKKGVTKLEKRRSPATVNRYHQAIRQVLAYGVKKRWVAKNTAKGIPRLKEADGRVRYLSDDERVVLLEACDRSAWDGLGLLVRMALSTGARRGELLGLRWKDIDVTRRVATLDHTKNGERRALPLVASVVERLKEWGRVRRLDTEYVFPSPKGDRPYQFRQHWEQAVKDAGIEDFRFHDLRHSCASYLAMAGASHLEIAEVLGHKTLAMVKRYSHLNHEHKADLLERVTGGLLGD